MTVAVTLHNSRKLCAKTTLELYRTEPEAIPEEACPRLNRSCPPHPRPRHLAAANKHEPLGMIETAEGALQTQAEAGIALQQVLPSDERYPKEFLV